MTTIELTYSNIVIIKKALLERLPLARSSHLTEALARAVGYRTHAALLADLRVFFQARPALVEVDTEAFVHRLKELGYQAPASTIYQALDDISDLIEGTGAKIASGLVSRGSRCYQGHGEGSGGESG